MSPPGLLYTHCHRELSSMAASPNANFGLQMAVTTKPGVGLRCASAKLEGSQESTHLYADYQY